MGNRIILVLGGARSGKSEFAEKLITKTAKGSIGYIATSQILDEEMKYRVILHQKRRPAEWKTYEIMHEAGDKIESILAGADSILFDCVTMYVNNMLMDHLTHASEETLGVSDLEMLQNNLRRDLGKMFAHIKDCQGKTILFVSDELGMGIVPANAMSRVYRDLVGLANQYIAKWADKVYLSIAGITIELKERGVEI
ncbi:MAG: bifunctional adenosylcobinamide kinase/adenosylcobinamide-phosphate guanylyltransferase [Dialister sp.]|nr:bifunctional adenosylcobinamide kinase/adenosylcobinamide-phosphate guanylyltransferase [Dialister sp.]